MWQFLSAGIFWTWGEGSGCNRDEGNNNQVYGENPEHTQVHGGDKICSTCKKEDRLNVYNKKITKILLVVQEIYHIKWMF